MQTVIALVGKIGSGKDEAATYLSKKLGWPVFKISDPLKQELKRQGREVNRENLATLGTTWSRQKGDDYLVRLALKKYRGNLILSGPRQLGQIEYLKNHTKLILVAIDASDQTRFERVCARGTVKEAQDLDAFIKEEIENDASDGANQVIECIAQASYRATNSASLAKLHRELDKIVKLENL